MAQLENGWISMQYPGPDLAKVEFKIGEDFYDAYLDWSGSKRIAKIRPPENKPLRPGTVIELWVNGGILRAERYNR